MLSGGGIHGVYQLAGTLTERKREGLKRKFCIDTVGNANVIFSRIVTFILVDIAWIFFRSSSVMSAIDYIKGMFFNLQLHQFFSPLRIIQEINISVNDVFIIMVGVVVLLRVDKLTIDRDFGKYVHQKPLWVRWTIYLALIFSTLIWGYYGYDYIQTQFIYFQF